MNTPILQDDQNPEIQAVKSAMKSTKNKRMFERYQTILLHLHGMKYDQIALIVGRSTVTIGSYVKAYRAYGLDGLVLGESPGRPSFLTKEQEGQVRKLLIEKRPADVGFPSEMNWNAPLLRQWILREFSVTYSERGTRKLLHLLGFSFTKPTYTLALADPQKQEQFKKDFDVVKKIDSVRN